MLLHIMVGEDYGRVVVGPGEAGGSLRGYLKSFINANILQSHSMVQVYMTH
jgi:hypothetical protein